MPISRKYNCLFVHIPKTGGTSIEVLLEMQASPENLCGGQLGIPCLQHLTPQQIRERIGSEIEKFYKFTIIRNPYDRVVSDYFWFKKVVKKVVDDTTTFKDFVKLRADVVTNCRYLEHMAYDHFRPQYMYLENITYNRILRLETLDRDIKRLGNDLKLGAFTLRKINTTEHGHYSIYYDDETRKIIQELEKPEKLGYSYEQLKTDN